MTDSRPTFGRDWHKRARSRPSWGESYHKRTGLGQERPGFDQNGGESDDDRVNVQSRYAFTAPLLIRGCIRTSAQTKQSRVVDEIDLCLGGYRDHLWDGFD